MNKIADVVNGWTPEDAYALLVRAVAEKGNSYAPTYRDAVEGCNYFDTVTCAPSCIVGYCFAYAGLTIDDFAAVNGEMFITLVPPPMRPTATVRMLQAAQAKQDNGGTWGEALYAARRSMEDGLS